MTRRWLKATLAFTHGKRCQQPILDVYTVYRVYRLRILFARVSRQRAPNVHAAAITAQVTGGSLRARCCYGYQLCINRWRRVHGVICDRFLKHYPGSLQLVYLPVRVHMAPSRPGCIRGVIGIGHSALLI